MTDNYDIDYNSLSDERLLKMVGEFIKFHRVERNIDQSVLATNAGISRSTLSLMENGNPVMFPSIIRVLRVLDLLYIFNTFKVENVVSPMAMLKLQQKQRKRASRKAK
jgi:transcriptional regulator with XRE-family HTH domain